MKAFLCISLLSLLTNASYGHEGLQEQAAQLTERLRVNSSNASLFLERGLVVRQSGDWMSAMRDFRRAEELDRTLVGLDLAYASLFIELRSWRNARNYLGSHLERFPEDLEASELLCQVLVGQREFNQAAIRYDAIVAKSKEPSPELFLARARAHAQAGDSASALVALNEGLTKLGQVPGLLLYAVELERERGEFDSALARVEALASRAGRPEHWLVLCAEIQLDAGRPLSALKTCVRARQALEALRPDKRAIQSVAELATRLEQVALVAAFRSTDSHEDLR